MEGYLELLRRCDAVYGLEGWEESSGAVSEVNLARELGMPVLLK